MRPKYNTEEESNAIRQFLIDKKHILKMPGIAKEVGIKAHLLYNLVEKSQYTLSKLSIAKLLLVIEQLGYHKVKKDDFDEIIKKVSLITKVPVNKITNCTQTRDVIRARQYIVIINEVSMKLNTKILGEKLGNKDHSSMTHTKKTALSYIQTKDSFFMEFYPEIEKKFGINTQKIIANNI